MNSKTFKETLVKLDDIKRFMKKFAGQCDTPLQTK